jgi:tetratricopeptide (TPR) repeat protein
VLVLLVGFAVAMSVQAARIARERDRTAREAAKAEAVRDFMEALLAAPDPVNALGPDASILEAVDRAVETSGEAFSPDPEVDAAIRTSIGRVYLRLGEYGAAAPLLERALEVRLALTGEGAETGETLGLLADLMRGLGDLDSAETLYARSERALGRSGAPHGPLLSDVAIRHADLRTAMGRYEEAESGLRTELSRMQNAGVADPSVAAVTSRLSVLYRALGDLDRAERFARESLEVRERLLPAGHVLIAESRNNLAMVLDDAGEKAAAAGYYRQALDTYETVFGPESEYVAIVLNNLALVMAGLGRDTEAEAHYRRALAIDERVLGGDNLGVAIDRLNLGRHLCTTDEAEEGMGLVTAAVGVIERELGPDPYEVTLARSARGVCLGALGRYADGERVLLDALERIETTMGADHPSLAQLRGRLADLYEAWGRPERAAEYRR